MLDPLPPINKAFSLIIQEERQRGLSSGISVPTSNSSNSNFVAFGVSTSNYKGKQNRPICTHCRKLGDTVNECYELHGFPPGYKFKNQSLGQHAHSKSVINQVEAHFENNVVSGNPSNNSVDAKVATPMLTPSQC
ncbi:Retrotran gag 3 domain-containing protein [Abeliophyllum distichum]|uniref:Retrotran gag 3 domain-containing protein n=1 Tax=Abeliophyllum distichum TaxID=126358 RepID=A0ABD1TKX4_9LAMI